jgi:hypothetical protein
MAAMLPGTLNPCRLRRCRRDDTIFKGLSL